MNIKDLIYIYIYYAEICSKVDYSDKKTVKANNKAVDGMYKLLRDFKSKSDDDSGELLTPLLENSETSHWAAHHILVLTPHKM